MKDFKYEVLYVTKHAETIAGFNNYYIALQFYESFVEKAYRDKWNKTWSIQLIQTETGDIVSKEDNK
jgi:hypothetical protein